MYCTCTVLEQGSAQPGEKGAEAGKKSVKDKGEMGTEAGEKGAKDDGTTGTEKEGEEPSDQVLPSPPPGLLVLYMYSA